MKKLLLAVVAGALAALALVAGAGARGPANAFAVGSGKADAFVGTEHLSFSAHNAPGPSQCAATGHLTYSTPVVSFSADVTGLVIVPNGSGHGGGAFIEAVVTRTSNGFTTPVGEGVYFDVTDSGLQPDGTGDLILFEFSTPTALTFCLAPLFLGHPITSGNINIKAEGPVGF